MGDLRIALDYFENIVDAKSDVGRQREIDRNAEQLKHILAKVQEKITSEPGPYINRQF